MRQALFLLGLGALLTTAAAYVWIQGPLREAAALEQQLAKSVGRIMVLDEVLTMSARMAASARDVRYEARYNEHVDELDQLLKATLSLVEDPGVVAAVASTDEANRRLVEFETRSFELGKQGRYDEGLQLVEGRAYRADKAVYAEGMSRAFARLQELTAERTRSVSRWANLLQLASVLALALVLWGWSLEKRERRRQAALHAANLEATVQQRTSELAHRTNAMRLVLDHVQQGLLTVDADGWMASERSASVERWLGPVSGELRFADYVRSQDPQFADTFALAMDAIKERMLPLECSLHDLPRRLRLGERTISVEYQEILSNGELDKLLIIMSDITAHLAQERADAEQRELLAVLDNVRRDKVGFLNFLEDSNGVVASLLTEALSPQHAARQLHTLKGNTGQFGLSLVARACHELETRVIEEGGFSAEIRDLLHEAWEASKARVRTVIGDDTSRNIVSVERTAYEDVVRQIRRRHPYEDILRALAAWELDPIQARLERLGETACALAERLGKAGLEVRCDAQGLRTDNAFWSPFWAACVHLARNAVDHGIEPAEVRLAAGKTAHGHLELSARVEQHEFIIELADDGAGIDWQRLTQAARERGLRIDLSDRTALLFIDGLSSKNDISDVSGRGVGMSAVREEVLRRGGSIAVDTRVGVGTRWILRFPAETMLGRLAVDNAPAALAQSA